MRRRHGVEWIGPGKARFVVWAPKPARLELELLDRSVLVPMARDEQGYAQAEVSRLASGGRYRYRAYSRMGLSMGQVAVVTAFCAFTFAYGSIFLGGIVLLGEPGLISRLFEVPEEVSITLGCVMLAGVVLYQIGSIFHFRPLGGQDVLDGQGV